MKDFHLQRLNRLQYFYYFLLGVISLTVITGVIFSMGQFNTTASAESTPISSLNLPAATEAASEAAYTDNSLVDSSPTEITSNPAELATTPVITERPTTTQTPAQATETRELSNTPTYITAAGRTNHISIVNDTSIDPGNEVKLLRYNGQLTNFYYGHNSSTVFGNLQSLHEGSTFSVTTENGQVRTYTVKLIKYLDFKDLSGENASNMTDVVFSRWAGTKYAISLMTCTSSSYYGGRLVIFAD
ncbi:sortase [Candidatus Saccharibacteria bacterium]|nr:sortase [Candidatus Saccharibacteria bacterium]